MNADFLSAIVAQKREAVARLHAQTDATTRRQRALEERATAQPHRLRAAFIADRPAIKIIAEFKRRSPSRGVIRSNLRPATAARAYGRGGACAISVLTDEPYFGGAIDDLIAARAATQLPILCKDFFIDPIQIYEAALAGADAILLLASILGDADLARLRTTAEDELGLDALIEVHSSDELRRAVSAGASLIGINNRNLRTLDVSLQTSEELIAQAPRDAIMISESGLQKAEDLRRLRSLGFSGFLVGEHLMQAADLESTLRELISAEEK